MYEQGLLASMQVAIVLNGDPPTDEDLETIANCDLIIAADGGANHLVDDGRLPTHLVGDMESVRPDVLEVLEDNGVPIKAHDRRKDEIDGMLALEEALRAGAKRILVLGGTGGRTAMTLANLQILRRCLELEVPAFMIGNGEEAFMVAEGQAYEMDAPAGTVFNVLPDTPDLVYSTKGSSFDVESLNIVYGSDRGVSNVTVMTPTRITVEQGRALIIIEHGTDL